MTSFSSLVVVIAPNPGIYPYGYVKLTLDFLQRRRRFALLALRISSRMPALLSGHPGDDHGDLRGVHDCPADRAEKHAGEPTAAVTADHQKLSGLGLFE